MNRGAAAPQWTRWAIAAGLAALVLRQLAAPVADLDMFHEMALIREALADGQLARQDVYAYTPTVSPVVHHEWATGVVLYFIAVAAGLGGGGILVLHYLLIAGIAACCYRCARLRGAHGAVLAPLAPVAIALLIPGTSPVRAQMFTFLFVACLLVMFEWDRRGHRGWLAIWLPLYVVWLNLHGGFIVGAGLFGLYAVERFVVQMGSESSARVALIRTRHLWLAGAAMVVLPLINPYGWEYLPYLWHALLLDRPHVAEWAPLWDPRVDWTYILIYIISLLFIAYAIARQGIRRLPGLLLVFATAALAARSQRLLPVYGIVWISYVPAYLSNTELRQLVETGWRRFAVPLAVAILLAAAVLAGKAVQMRFWELRVPVYPVEGELHYPGGAVDYLAAQQFAGNLMTPFNAGAFISWKLFPAVKVGMDSRYEVAYPVRVADENATLYNGEAGWQEILEKYPTDAVLVPAGSALNRLLAMHPEWPRVYVDDGYAVFARLDVAMRLPVVDRTGEPITARFP